MKGFTAHSKYHAKKTQVNGITFDSKREAHRYTELRIMEINGEITGLQLQPCYVLIPPQYRNGKLVERGIKYKADFAYYLDGALIVEDVKGVQTEAYKLKRKMMLYFNDIQIKEVK